MPYPAGSSFPYAVGVGALAFMAFAVSDEMVAAPDSQFFMRAGFLLIGISVAMLWFPRLFGFRNSNPADSSGGPKDDKR